MVKHLMVLIAIFAFAGCGTIPFEYDPEGPDTPTASILSNSKDDTAEIEKGSGPGRLIDGQDKQSLPGLIDGQNPVSSNNRGR